MCLITHFEAISLAKCSIALEKLLFKIELFDFIYFQNKNDKFKLFSAPLLCHPIIPEERKLKIIFICHLNQDVPSIVWLHLANVPGWMLKFPFMNFFLDWACLEKPPCEYGKCHSSALDIFHLVCFPLQISAIVSEAIRSSKTFLKRT